MRVTQSSVVDLYEPDHAVLAEGWSKEIRGGPRADSWGPQAEAFMNAISYGTEEDLKAVQAFLKNPPRGFDFNASNYVRTSGLPLLHHALTSQGPKSIEILKLLLADPRVDLATAPDRLSIGGKDHISVIEYARLVDAGRKTPASAEAVQLVETRLAHDTKDKMKDKATESSAAGGLGR